MVSRIKQTILSIAIAIVFALFVGYGISTFYKQPKYEDFCEEEIMIKSNWTQEECTAKGGKWTPRTYECPPGQECEDGYCDPSYTCRQGYEDETQGYDRNVFIITLVIGLAAILLGGIFLKLESVGSGLMGGGVLTVIYGTIRYWGYAPDVLRFTILGIVLAVLIWIGYTKLNPYLKESLDKPIEEKPAETKKVAGKARNK